MRAPPAAIGVHNPGRRRPRSARLQLLGSWRLGAQHFHLLKQRPRVKLKPRARAIGKHLHIKFSSQRICAAFKAFFNHRGGRRRAHIARRLGRPNRALQWNKSHAIHFGEGAVKQIHVAPRWRTVASNHNGETVAQRGRAKQLAHRGAII